MTYIENVFVCMAAPLVVALLSLKRGQRAALVFCLAGMGACLLSAYLNTFFARLYQADAVNAATQIAPVVEEIMKLLPDVKLTILAGSNAVKYYLNQWSKARLEDTVKHFQEYLPKYFPIVHPSGRTDIWRTEHPWFDETVVPALREHVHAILGK